MKKFIIYLTVGFSLMMLTSSCRWIHETFYSVEGCAEWYAEELYDAAIDNDIEDFIERYDQMHNWIEGLDKKDQKRAKIALEEWSDKHEIKDRYIEKFANQHCDRF